MKLIIAEDIVNVFHHLRIGVVVARGIDNLGYSEEIERIKRASAEAVRQKLSPENLSRHPYIAAWRETYRRFGTKPKKYRPTAEALLRRILRGEDIPTISKVVDLYLAVEAEFYLPIGGYDLDRITGDIVLRFSPGGESFIPFGMTQVKETTYPGEIVYSDSSKILTRRWNYRDCDSAKITRETRNLVLFCEAALSDIPIDPLARCVQQLAIYLQRFCNGSIVTHLIEARVKREQEL